MRKAMVQKEVECRIFCKVSKENWWKETEKTKKQAKLEKSGRKAKSPGSPTCKSLFSLEIFFVHVSGFTQQNLEQDLWRRSTMGKSTCHGAEGNPFTTKH